MPRVIARGAAWAAVALTSAALACAAVRALLPVSEHAPTKAELVACCLGTVGAGLLLCPARLQAFPGTGRGALAWPICLGATAGALMLLLGPQPAPWGIVLRLAAAVLVLTFLLDGLHHLLTAWSFADWAASCVLWTALALAVMAPLWLGPWAERFSATESLANAVLWVSPLTYLASAAEYDYLRSQWFYLRSPIGAIRYEYPGPLALGAWHLLLGLACRPAARFVRGRRSRRRPAA